MSATEKSLHDVLVAPVVSEKSYNLVDQGQYTFLVDTRSNKTEIKNAVESIYGVEVASINTINRPGKRQRTKFGWGQRKNTKRAIVTLKGDATIDIFGGPLA
ncbi:MAG: 50S ribosomal protein L23 [Galactobacter sp.]